MIFLLGYFNILDMLKCVYSVDAKVLPIVICSLRLSKKLQYDPNFDCIGVNSEPSFVSDLLEWWSKGFYK